MPPFIVNEVTTSGGLEFVFELPGIGPFDTQKEAEDAADELAADRHEDIYHVEEI